MDAVCAAAVDLARAAAEEVAGVGLVGEHLSIDGEGERLATHAFASLSPAYVGWHWSVTVARANRAKVATVDEVCLLPGSGALLAPAWVPYADRLQPGDLGPGDLLPTDPDDERGLGRVRVLSLVGLDDAADRWVNGPGGPHAPLAEAAPGPCVSCGFLVVMPGLLGQAFGVCANESSPSDGRVVTFDHGCGAHSEAVTVLSLSSSGPHVLDEVGYDEFGHG